MIAIVDQVIVGGSTRSAVGLFIGKTMKKRKEYGYKSDMHQRCKDKKAIFKQMSKIKEKGLVLIKKKGARPGNF